MTDLATEIQNYLVGTLPIELFLRFQEEADAAMHEAWRRANETGRYEEKARSAVLGHERHWNLERALGEAAARSKCNFAYERTNPAGGSYAVVQVESWIVGRAVLPHPAYPLRPAKYRRVLARLNASASAALDLFEKNLPVSPPKYGLFLTTPDRRQPEKLARLMFGVPRSGLDGWLYLEPLEVLLSKFTEAEKSTAVPVEKIPDAAVPRLKKSVA